MDLEYIQRVQKWVSLDNKILKNKHIVSDNELAIKDTIEEKKKIESEIIDYVQRNDLTNLVIEITGGKIKFSKKTQQQALSLSLLKSCFDEYSEKYPDEPLDSIKLLDFVKNSLKKTVVYSMKR